MVSGMSGPAGAPALPPVLMGPCREPGSVMAPHMGVLSAEASGWRLSTASLESVQVREPDAKLKKDIYLTPHLLQITQTFRLLALHFIVFCNDLNSEYLISFSHFFNKIWVFLLESLFSTPCFYYEAILGYHCDRRTTA